MKLLPTQPRAKAYSSGEPLGLGIEAAVILALFFFAGFGLDRLLSTTPLMMIVLTVIGSIGLFARYKVRYDERMTELETQRADREAARRGRTTAQVAVSPAVNTVVPTGGPDDPDGLKGGVT
jgi:F0F1-type ATP synthase assembly protein I